MAHPVCQSMGVIPPRVVDSFEFSSIHFSGRDENLTFTQLEQRGWLRITENLTSDGS